MDPESTFQMHRTYEVAGEPMTVVARHVGEDDPTPSYVMLKERRGGSLRIYPAEPAGPETLGMEALLLPDEWRLAEDGLPSWWLVCDCKDVTEIYPWEG